MIDTTFEQFAAQASKGSVVPVCCEVMADLLTPVSAFLKIAEDNDYSFLLESVEGGARVARYSFLGKDPFSVLRSKSGQTVLERDGGKEVLHEPFLNALRTTMSEYRAAEIPELPRFTGGAVGFFGYDSAAWFEPTLERGWAAYSEPRSREDDAAFMFFDTVLAFDHVKHRILIIGNAMVRELEKQTLVTAYEFARAKIRFLKSELQRQLSILRSPESKELEVRSNTTKEEFERAVDVAKEYIKAGDVFQVVLSQRFEVDLNVDPFTVYRALRYVNPSPYMYFIRMGQLAIVGSSPEMLVRVEGSRAETHPIAGTRPRGRTEEQDIALGEELRADEKERAEHVMLVDLGRNDLGRVSEYGSVQVPQFMELERYSHVMHLVSRVESRLSSQHDRLDALAACFPAGTVSGAPKIRAMEIIAELESARRGIYAGAIGYLDFAGHLDCCIAIRTIVIRDGRAYVQAGAGIVADSNSEAEYRETEAKASALLRALAMAQTGEGPSTV